MKRIVNFDVNAEHYSVCACLVWCFDQRFAGLVTGVMDYYGFEKIDPVNIAGGVKDLATGSPYSRDYLLEQIGAAIRLHRAKKIILMAHADCGAYGLHFNDDEASLAHYKNQLDRGEEAVAGYFKRNGLDVPIIKIYADFKGAMEV